MADARKTDTSRYPEIEAILAKLPEAVRPEMRRKLEAQLGGRVQVNGDTGQVSGSTAPAQSPEQAIINQILEESRKDKTAATQSADDFLGGFVPREQGAADFAATLGAGDLSRLTGELGSDEQAIGGYGGPVDDVVSQGAQAFADAKSRSAQYDALDRLKGFSSIQETPEEKLMRLQARMAEERDQRAAREAALRDLASRGANSGTAELAALVGGQQVTAQNRTLSDLGAQANASKRALIASQAYSDAAGQLAGQTFDERYKTGLAGDDVSKFNATTRADYNEKKARFDQDEKMRRFKDYLATSQQTQQYGRDLTGAQHGISQTAGAGTAAKIGAQTGTGTQDALKIALGNLVNQKAVNELKPPKSFNLLDPTSWF